MYASEQATAIYFFFRFHSYKCIYNTNALLKYSKKWESCIFFNVHTFIRFSRNIFSSSRVLLPLNTA